MSRTLKSVRLNNDLIKKIEAEGRNKNRNFTNMVETILKEYFERK